MSDHIELRELMLKFSAEMFDKRNVMNPTTKWEHLTAHQRSVVTTYESEMQALIATHDTNMKKKLLEKQIIFPAGSVVPTTHIEETYGGAKPEPEHVHDSFCLKYGKCSE